MPTTTPPAGMQWMLPCSGTGVTVPVPVVPEDPATTDPNFDLSNYINVTNIDNDLNDVSVMPNYTGASLDDNIGADFDPLINTDFITVNVDNSFSSNTQLNRVYNLMKSNFTIQKALSKFFGKNTPVNLEFKAYALDSLTRGLTIPIGYPSNPYPNKIIIVIDPIKANGRPDLLVAKTIIHEIVHAEIYRILRLGNLGILPNEYNKILNALLSYYHSYPKANPKVNKHWDHGYMAQHYLSTIANELQEYDNNSSVPLCFYKMLSWEGLKDTPYYNKMSSSDKQKVLDAITNYISTQTISTCIN